MKPILFNTGMTRAILEGRKTVTRRVVKPQPNGNGMVKLPDDSCWPGYWAEVGSPRVIKPPYKSGDVLYVRETWAELETVYGVPYYAYKADDSDLHHSSGENFSRWYPSIYMPREAARIFLRVTGVRVERLQELTLKDAEMEGMDLRGPMFVDFVKVWNNTVQRHPNKFKRYPYCWEDNPWVWVIEFERISKEEAINRA